MNCFKGRVACLAYDSDSVDDDVDVLESRNPIVDAKIMREVGEYKLVVPRSGKRCAARGNYHVTSAMQSLVEMPTYKTGGAGQQDAHARSTSS